MHLVIPCFPAPRRTRRALTGLFAVVAIMGPAACGDGPTEGRSPVAGRYALVTVNGGAVPWSGALTTVGGVRTITGGDLLLRADGTFGVGIRGDAGSFTVGRYTSDSTTTAGDRALTLHYVNGPTPTDSAHTMLLARADSVIWIIPPASGYLGARFAFVRAATPVAPPVEGTFALTSVGTDDVAPFELFSTVNGEERNVRVVAYDTLTFEGDGLFFRQHRLEQVLSISAQGDTTPAALWSWIAWGSYSSGANGKLILQGFSPTWDDREADTVWVASGGVSLERRWLRLDDTIVERLTRVP